MVEDVVVAFVVSLVDDARLFQQVGAHRSPDDVVGIVEADLDVFAEARRVVVPRRLGVSDRLHDRVRRQNLFLDLPERESGSLMLPALLADGVTYSNQLENIVQNASFGEIILCFLRAFQIQNTRRSSLSFLTLLSRAFQPPPSPT